MQLYIVKISVVREFHRGMTGRYVTSTENLAEEEWDIWRIEYLSFPVRIIASNPTKRINFTMIPQKGIRKQTKIAVRITLRYLAMCTVQQQIRAMNRFSQYLSRKNKNIESLTDINRDIFEEYLLHIDTAVGDKKFFQSELSSLKVSVYS